MPLAPALRGQLIRAKTDVALMGDQGEQESIHSVLLMTLSPYFHTALDCLQQEKSLRIYGADREVLNLIKEYAYEGKLTGLSSDNLDKVFRVADMYNIIGIIDECNLIRKNLNQQQEQSQAEKMGEPEADPGNQMQTDPITTQPGIEPR